MRIWVGMPNSEDKKYVVLLDGVKVKDCIEADDETGKVWVPKRNKEGTIVYGYGDVPELEVLRGKVEFRAATYTEEYVSWEMHPNDLIPLYTDGSFYDGILNQTSYYDTFEQMIDELKRLGLIE